MTITTPTVRQWALRAHVSIDPATSTLRRSTPLLLPLCGVVCLSSCGVLQAIVAWLLSCSSRPLRGRYILKVRTRSPLSHQWLARYLRVARSGHGTRQPLIGTIVRTTRGEQVFR